MMINVSFIRQSNLKHDVPNKMVSKYIQHKYQEKLSNYWFHPDAIIKLPRSSIQRFRTDYVLGHKESLNISSQYHQTIRIFDDDS